MSIDDQNTVRTLDGQGFVRLVDVMGDDLTVVNAARVSFRKQSYELDEKDVKLINYLAKHKHWTPFAHPQVCFHVKAPIFVARQLFKAKVGAVENEVSRRYVDDAPEFYYPTLWRKRPEKGIKQGSQMANIKEWQMVEEFYNKSLELAAQAYEFATINGLAPELARSVLPQAMMTEWWWTVSLSTAARVFNQRSDAHAQAECQDYAWAIDDLLSPNFPFSWEALTRNHDDE